MHKRNIDAALWSSLSLITAKNKLELFRRVVRICEEQKVDEKVPFTCHLEKKIGFQALVEILKA